MDKYDEAVAYLTENPDDIEVAWFTPSPITPEPIVKAHCLFQFATKSGDSQDDDDGPWCGCLTQIRAGWEEAATESLTNLIREDERLPDRAWRITVESLPVFAEWQRKIDRILSREGVK